MGIHDKSHQAQTIKTSLGRPSSSQALSVTMSNEDKARLVAMLAGLSSHFWTPDFTPAQAAARYRDYTDDLAGCTIAEIEVAIREYRLRPKIPGRMKPFPGSDDLLEIVQANRKHRREVENMGRPVRQESRPIWWWAQSRKLWQAHWRESEVPLGERVQDEKTGKLREPVRA